MMSQNRQEERDRLSAENDYKVNLKAESEIRSLHDKIDHIMTQKWNTLIEIQEIQLEILRKETKPHISTHKKTTESNENIAS
jgi:uncharacterized membrane protein